MPRTFKHSSAAWQILSETNLDVFLSMLMVAMGAVAVGTRAEELSVLHCGASAQGR